jgi:CheY-like chemotaxis protein
MNGSDLGYNTSLESLNTTCVFGAGDCRLVRSRIRRDPCETRGAGASKYMEQAGIGLKISLQGFVIILVDGSSVARSIFSAYINRASGSAITTRNGAEALEVMRKTKTHLLVTDIRLADMSGFDLIAKAREMNVNIPSIIITTLNIDEYIDLAIEKDIGNILTKEISEEAFVRTCFNIISGKNIFGLEYYIPRSGKIERALIDCSGQIGSVIRSITSYGEEHGLPKAQKPFLAVILDEIVSNAVYHAHGYTKEKISHKEICLDREEVVEVCYGHNRDYLGVSVTDHKGILTKKTILSSFKNVIDQKKLIDESCELGLDITDKISLTGRGLQMIRLMANDYYFNIKRNNVTQVIALVNISEKAIVYHNSSIRINEII